MKIRKLLSGITACTLALGLSSVVTANELPVEKSNDFLEQIIFIGETLTIPRNLEHEIHFFEELDNSLNSECTAIEFTDVPELPVNPMSQYSIWNTNNIFKIREYKLTPLAKKNGIFYTYGTGETVTHTSSSTFGGITVPDSYQQNYVSLIEGLGYEFAGWRFSGTVYMDSYLTYHIIYNTYNHTDNGNNSKGAVINSFGTATVTTDYLISDSTPSTFKCGFDGYGVMQVYNASLNMPKYYYPEYSMFAYFQ